MPIVYTVVVTFSFRLLGMHLDETNDTLAVAVYRGFRLLADATLPLLVLILGMQIHQHQPDEVFGPLVAPFAIRLGAMVPVFCLVLMDWRCAWVCCNAQCHP